MNLMNKIKYKIITFLINKKYQQTLDLKNLIRRVDPSNNEYAKDNPLC